MKCTNHAPISHNWLPSPKDQRSEIEPIEHAQVREQFRLRLRVPHDLIIQHVIDKCLLQCPFEDILSQTPSPTTPQSNRHDHKLNITPQRTNTTRCHEREKINEKGSRILKLEGKPIRDEADGGRSELQLGWKPQHQCVLRTNDVTTVKMHQTQYNWRVVAHRIHNIYPTTRHTYESSRWHPNGQTPRQWAKHHEIWYSTVAISF